MSHSVLERDEDWRSPSGGGQERERHSGPPSQPDLVASVLHAGRTVDFGRGLNARRIIAVRGLDRCRRHRRGDSCRSDDSSGTRSGSECASAGANLDLVASTVVFHFLQHAGLSHPRRRRGQGNPLDAYAMIRILPEAFVFITLIIRLILKKPNWLGALFRGIPGAMAIYCLVCLATTAWSVNASWTAYKSLEFLADVSLLAAIVASAEGFFTYKNLVDWTLTFYGLSLVGVWINLPIWPTEAMDGGRLTGVIPVEASNSVGTSGGVLAIVALCRLMPVFGAVKNRAWYFLLLIFGLVSMVLSKTRNSEAAFIFAVVLIVLLSKRLRRIAAWGGVVLAPIVAVAILINGRLLTYA